MKKIYLAILVMLPLLFTSCLKSNLEEIQVYQEANITSIRGMYYYFDIETTHDGNVIFSKGDISRANVQIDTEAGNIVIGKATPAKANITSFSPQKVVMMFNISTAATIEPIEGSARLGVEADWTVGKTNKYKVTAADGNSKVWSVTVQSYITE